MMSGARESLSRWLMRLNHSDQKGRGMRLKSRTLRKINMTPLAILNVDPYLCISKQYYNPLFLYRMIKEKVFLRPEG